MKKITQKVYTVCEEEDKRELFHEETRNEDGQVITYASYDPDDQSTGYNEYNERGLLTKEVESIDGIENSRSEYEYDSEDRLTNTKLYVAQELFQETTTEFFKDGFVNKIFRHGEEIERVLEKKDGDQYIKEFFHNNELIEIHRSKYDSNLRIQTVQMEDQHNVHTGTWQVWSDEEDNELALEEKNENGQIMVRTENKFEKGKLVHEKHENFREDEYYQVAYAYDDNDNHISTETKTLSDKILGFYKYTYDSEGRIIHSMGYGVGSFDAIHGLHKSGLNYTLEYEYIGE